MLRAVLVASARSKSSGWGTFRRAAESAHCSVMRRGSETGGGRQAIRLTGTGRAGTGGADRGLDRVRLRGCGRLRFVPHRRWLLSADQDVMPARCAGRPRDEQDAPQHGQCQGQPRWGSPAGSRSHEQGKKLDTKKKEKRRSHILVSK